MTNLPIPETLLSAQLQKTVGNNCHLLGVQRLTDGTRKKVYRLDLTPPNPPLVLLVWHNEHDYFNEQSNPQGNLSDTIAPKLYAANTRLLTGHGLRVPQLLHFDESRSAVPHAFALVEYVQAVSFNEYRAAHPGCDVSPILAAMRDYLARLHSITRSHWGTVLESTPYSQDYPDQNLYDEALPDLHLLAQAHPAVAQYERAIEARLREWRAQLAPRTNYAFIHNELGPDEHFLIEESGAIVILDIDGCHFADVERDYAYLRLRFGDHYPSLTRPDLDPIRMDFYQLCLHIMASYGHYLLLTKGYPGENDLRQIYEGNAEKAVHMAVMR